MISGGRFYRGLTQRVSFLGFAFRDRSAFMGKGCGIRFVLCPSPLSNINPGVQGPPNMLHKLNTVPTVSLAVSSIFSLSVQQQVIVTFVYQKCLISHLILASCAPVIKVVTQRLTTLRTAEKEANLIIVAETYLSICSFRPAMVSRIIFRSFSS